MAVATARPNDSSAEVIGMQGEYLRQDEACRLKERIVMTLRRILAISMATGVMAATSSRAVAQDPGATGRTLVAVFAHPDDETIAGPLLARYGRDPGTKVYLVLLTNGEKGVTPFAKIPAGEALAAVRAKEAECACRALGIEPPIRVGLPDGGLASMQVLAQAAGKLRDAVDPLKPDAIVTWGPDGGYGHPDHRLASALVTQIVQGGGWTRRLYYAGLPKSGLEANSAAALKFPAPFAPVVDELLNVRVPYSPEDAERARQSLACHASQFTPDAMALISTLTEKIHAGRMHLRSWAGGPAATDLFER
jgi:LmbE family N-acetylglucosaminyl deacetylase